MFGYGDRCHGGCTRRASVSLGNGSVGSSKAATVGSAHLLLPIPATRSSERNVLCACALCVCFLCATSRCRFGSRSRGRRKMGKDGSRVGWFSCSFARRSRHTTSISQASTLPMAADTSASFVGVATSRTWQARQDGTATADRERWQG